MPFPTPDVTSTPTGQIVAIKPKAAVAIASTGNAGLDAFARGLAAKLGIQPTAAYMKMVAAWHQAEGGHASNNPFNTTQNYAGASAYNHFGNGLSVKNYPSLQAGIEATYQTLMNGHYSGIIQSLKSGNVAGFGNAIAQSPWGTNGHLVAQILGQSSIPVSYSSGNYTGSTGTSSVPSGNLNGTLGTDTLYQGQVAAMQKQLSEFLGGQEQAKANELAHYGNQVHALNEQNVQNQDTTLDSYGGRGLAHSSLYGDALTNLAQKFNAQKSSYDDANKQFLATLGQNTRLFEDQQQNAMQQALADAAARRAAGISVNSTGLMAIPKTAIPANPNLAKVP